MAPVLTVVSDLLVGLVALLHAGFLVLEMFLWDRPAGMRIFGHSRKSAGASETLAMNLGLYNGFLAAGLVWGLSLGAAGGPVKGFFLGCVLVAGIFGGVTASRKIFLVQAFPAAAALLLLLIA
jgi:putative membrane protein